MWTILSIIALVALILFRANGSAPVWGSLMFGVLGGLIAARMYSYGELEYPWWVIGKWCVVFVVVTFFAEVIRWTWKRFRVHQDSLPNRE
jgi:hypothetical protein